MTKLFYVVNTFEMSLIYTTISYINDQISFQAIHRT